MRPLALFVARTRQDRFSSRSRSFSIPRLIGSTLGDELKWANGSEPHIIGVSSMKDSAAILPAGHHPNGAFWFNSTEGQFIKSTYYINELPSWVLNSTRNDPLTHSLARRGANFVRSPTIRAQASMIRL